MKKEWVRPQTLVQSFAANEYVAACGDENKVYKFKCDAGDGEYGGLYDSNWHLLSNRYNSYHACGDTHDATTTDAFVKGYFDPDKNHNNGNEVSVYIWLETNRWNQVVDRHATTDLDMSTWETAKS